MKHDEVCKMYCEAYCVQLESGIASPLPLTSEIAVIVFTRLRSPTRSRSKVRRDNNTVFMSNRFRVKTKVCWNTWFNHNKASVCGMPHQSYESSRTSAVSNGVPWIQGTKRQKKISLKRHDIGIYEPGDFFIWFNLLPKANTSPQWQKLVCKFTRGFQLQVCTWSSSWTSDKLSKALWVFDGSKDVPD